MPSRQARDGTGVPRTSSPVVDLFHAPGSTTALELDVGVAIAPADAGLTPAAWRSKTAEAWEGEPCSAAEHEEPITVGREPGVLRSFHCSHFLTDDVFAMEALAVHGSSGVLVVWANAAGSEGSDQATFRDIVASLQYMP
jgi:hypothetical protein